LKSGRQFSKSEELLASCEAERSSALLDTRESFTDYRAAKSNVCSSSSAFRDVTSPSNWHGIKISTVCTFITHWERKPQR